MKRQMLIIVLLLLILASITNAQKMIVKDSDSNVLMEVNDEGTIGSITLPSGSAPSSTTNKLYNVSGTLHWSGNSVITSTSSSGLHLKTYDSGWFEIAPDGTYTKTHNLGTTKLIVQLYYAPNSDGSGMQRLANARRMPYTHSDIGHEGTTIKDITTTQLTVQCGHNVGNTVNSSGVCTVVPNNGYARVIVISLE